MHDFLIRECQMDIAQGSAEPQTILFPTGTTASYSILLRDRHVGNALVVTRFVKRVSGYLRLGHHSGSHNRALRGDEC